MSTLFLHLPLLNFCQRRNHRIKNGKFSNNFKGLDDWLLPIACLHLIYHLSKAASLITEEIVKFCSDVSVACTVRDRRRRMSTFRGTAFRLCGNL